MPLTWAVNSGLREGDEHQAICSATVASNNYTLNYYRLLNTNKHAYADETLSDVFPDLVVWQWNEIAQTYGKVKNKTEIYDIKTRYCLLGILLIALSGRNTRIVRIAERFKFCESTAYSSAL